MRKLIMKSQKKRKAPVRTKAQEEGLPKDLRPQLHIRVENPKANLKPTPKDQKGPRRRKRSLKVN